MVYRTKKFDLVQRISKIKTNRASVKSAESKQTENEASDSAPVKKVEKNRDHLKIFLDTGMVELVWLWLAIVYKQIIKSIHLVKTQVIYFSWVFICSMVTKNISPFESKRRTCKLL